jgi:L-ascorbate metabolism protein UlaG (beta-lactamase superfamily)
MFAVRTDQFKTASGTLKITPIHHASLMMEAKGQVLHVDPVGRDRYLDLPKADLILITHAHADHFDLEAIDLVRKPGTVILAPEAVAEKLKDVLVLHNGESVMEGPWKIRAIPMYNVKRQRSPGKPYHPRGWGNGYVVTYGGFRTYIAGDTEGVPEMRSLKNIDVAFIPMNMPYTMPPEEAAAAVKAFHPRIVYPYHYRGSDLSVFEKALAGSGIKVRLRDWYE